MGKDEDRKELKEMENSYKEGNTKVGETFKHIFDGLSDKFLSMDDEFPFDHRKCVEECGGLCCLNIPVSINPYDVYRIVTSERGKELGLTDTTKLFDPEKPLFDLYLGEKLKRRIRLLVKRGF
jgi:hypothetical protein